MRAGEAVALMAKMIADAIYNDVDANAISDTIACTLEVLDSLDGKTLERLACTPIILVSYNYEITRYSHLATVAYEKLKKEGKAVVLKTDKEETGVITMGVFFDDGEATIIIGDCLTERERLRSKLMRRR